MRRQLHRYLFTARRSLALLTAGPFSRGGRRELGSLATTLGWRRHASALPLVSIDDILPPAPIELVGLDASDWNTTTTELAVLALAARRWATRRIFEFGTYDGRSTATMLLNAAGGDAAHAHTLDLPPAAHRPGDEQPPVGARLREQPRCAGRYTQILHDSLTFDASPHAGQIDLTFIDGGHSHECALADTRNALAMRSPNGAILWHDYGGAFPGVTRVVDDLAAREPSLTFAHLRGTLLAIAYPR